MNQFVYDRVYIVQKSENIINGILETKFFILLNQCQHLSGQDSKYLIASAIILSFNSINRLSSDYTQILSVQLYPIRLELFGYQMSG